MDDNYPTLKRPKKKLIYPSTKTHFSNRWAQDVVSLEDVDKMFDDLDSKGEDFPSPSPEIHIPKHTERPVTPVFPSKRLDCQMVPNEDHNSGRPEFDTETPFKAHGPVKTSSPIEENAIQHKNKQGEKEDNSASPILFDFEEENQDLETAEKKCQHYNRRKEESDDSIFETLPKTPAFNKISAQKKKNTPARTKHVSPVRLEAMPAPPEKQTKRVQVPTSVKHDLSSFLQKLKDASQPKTTSAGFLQAKVMPPVPESEDDFLILEDDAPLYVFIPNKTAKSSKDKQSKTSSSDKETMDSPEKKHSIDKVQGAEQLDRNPESQTLNKKSKKKAKGKVSESSSDASHKDKNLPATVESSDAGNLLEHDKAKKKKTHIKKVPLKNDDNPKAVGKGTDTDDGISSKNAERKGEKLVEERESKLAKNNHGKSQKKKIPAKESRKAANKANAVTDGPQALSQDCESQPGEDFPVLGVNSLEAKSVGDQEDVNIKPVIASCSMEGTSDEGDKVLGKRKRKPIGQWWMISSQSPPQQQTEKQPMVKKAKCANKDSGAPITSPAKATAGARKKNLKQFSSSSSDAQRPKATEKRKVKTRNQKRERPLTRTSSEDSDEVFPESSQAKALNEDSDSNNLLFPHREHRNFSGEKVFPTAYPNSSTEKVTSSPTRPEEPLDSRETTKRRRKPPGGWWHVNTSPEDQEPVSSQPPQQKHKVAAERKGKQAKKPTSRSLPKPLEGASKQKKATYNDLSSTVTESPLLRPSSPENTEAAHEVLAVETDENERGQDQFPSQDLIQGTSKIIRSGPSSMIGLENYEEEIVLPSTSVQLALCASDLCAPPLRPLVLQPKDKVNLGDWLKSLWPTVNRGPSVTPDDFEWYCYQGRALGLMVDLHSGSICNGKMLLGSYMKKPLWVDHSATTVYSVLTSSVSLIVDCNKSCYSAGQSFMVPPGHAYSIHNLSAVPAVFYFTRIYAEEADE